MVDIVETKNTKGKRSFKVVYIQTDNMIFDFFDGKPKISWADYDGEDVDSMKEKDKDYGMPWITVPKGGTKRMQRKNFLQRKRALKQFKNN